MKCPECSGEIRFIDSNAGRNYAKRKYRYYFCDNCELRITLSRRVEVVIAKA